MQHGEEEIRGNVSAAFSVRFTNERLYPVEVKFVGSIHNKEDLILEYL